MTKQEKEQQIARLMFTFPSYADGSPFIPYEFKKKRKDAEGRAIRLAHMKKLIDSGVSLSQVARLYRITRARVCEIMKS